MSATLSLSDLFKSSFYATPHPYLLLNPNLKIIDANDCYLAATMTRRADIMQAGMFDVFPDNPGDPNASGVTNLSQSLIRVLDSGKADRMPLQRYDIRDDDGIFQERWWQPLNIPVFDERGHLSTIIHYVEDVTDALRQEPAMAATARPLEGQILLAATIEASLHRGRASLRATETDHRGTKAGRPTNQNCGIALRVPSTGPCRPSSICEHAPSRIAVSHFRRRFASGVVLCRRGRTGSTGSAGSASGGATPEHPIQ